MTDTRHQARGRELLPLIEKLQSPISSDDVARMTAIAAGTIRDLWMELEACEARIEHLRKREKPTSRPSPISQSDADEPQQDR
jgi:hypothetical protein